MSFTTALRISGFARKKLDTASELAIIDATASAMDITASDISLSAFTTESSSAQRLRKRRLAGYDVAIYLGVSVSMHGFSLYDSPEALYTALESSLTSSVKSGSYDSLLRKAATSRGSTSLAGASCYRTEVYGLSVTSLDDSASSPLASSVIAGIVAGVVAFATIILFIIWYCYFRPPTKVAVYDVTKDTPVIAEAVRSTC